MTVIPIPIDQSSVAAPNDKAFLVVSPDKNLLRTFRGAFDCGFIRNPLAERKIRGTHRPMCKCSDKKEACDIPGYQADQFFIAFVRLQIIINLSFGEQYAGLCRADDRIAWFCPKYPGAGSSRWEIALKGTSCVLPTNASFRAFS
jgi:hypothetical protein